MMQRSWVCVTMALTAAACAAEQAQPRLPIMGDVRVYSGAIDDNACSIALRTRYRHPDFDERLLTPPPAGETVKLPPDRRRIAGDPSVAPDDDTKFSLGIPAKIVAQLKICVGADGVPTTVTLLRSSCVKAYDLQLLDEVRRWRYTPVAAADAPTPQCTAASFVYSQR